MTHRKHEHGGQRGLRLVFAAAIAFAFSRFARCADVFDDRGVLVVAAGVAYYFARKDIDERRHDQMTRKVRSLEQRTLEDRLREDAAASAAKPPGLAAASTNVTNPSTSR